MIRGLKLSSLMNMSRHKSFHLSLAILSLRLKRLKRTKTIICLIIKESPLFSILTRVTYLLIQKSQLQWPSTTTFVESLMIELSQRLRDCKSFSSPSVLESKAAQSLSQLTKLALTTKPLLQLFQCLVLWLTHSLSQNNSSWETLVLEAFRLTGKYLIRKTWSTLITTCLRQA